MLDNVDNVAKYLLHVNFTKVVPLRILAGENFFQDKASVCFVGNAIIIRV